MHNTLEMILYETLYHKIDLYLKAILFYDTQFLELG